MNDTKAAGAESRFHNILSRCSHQDFGYGLVQEGLHFSLRVFCRGSDNISKEPHTWQGRKWRLSSSMTDGEIVQTAFLATITAIEHETREKFLFDQVSVFDPHYDIHQLVALRRSTGSIAIRPPATEEEKL